MENKDVTFSFNNTNTNFGELNKLVDKIQFYQYSLLLYNSYHCQIHELEIGPHFYFIDNNIGYINDILAVELEISQFFISEIWSQFNATSKNLAANIRH